MPPPPSSRKRPKNGNRGFSGSLRLYRTHDERDHLLAAAHDEEEHADSDGLYPPNCCWTSDNPDPPNPHGGCKVYENIHRIRREIVNSIDDPYSLEQLRAPRMNLLVVRPLVDQFYGMQDVSIVYCLLVNRTQFIREQSYATHHQTVNLSRALLCELVAEKILRRYHENNPGPKGLLRLANILVSGFEPFQNAPQQVIQENMHVMHWASQKNGRRHENKMTALEVAIVSESKSFLASSACQKVMDAIYRGKLVYTPSSFIDIIPDHWKRRPISLYDPRRGPLLNQYRLIVPRTRNAIEIGQFVVLLVLYIIVMFQRESRLTTAYSTWELVFDIYGCGWVLDQIASVLEHGWHVYSQNLWSFLDVTFVCLFSVYFALRMHAFTITDSEESMHIARTSLDVLSIAAPVLIPRLAFNVMSENILFVSLRAMFSDFMTLTALAVWSFAGFLLSMKWLHNGAHESITISKWMVWIWFGLDGTGIQESPDFHWFLGPTLMITFAFLGNTLFLTILVSMLSNTFSQIVANAVPEIQYRRAVLTFEGVKSDAIFAYMPPFNILALVIMLPLKLILTPHSFHKVNVYATRTLNLPLLLIIGLHERRTLWMADRHRHARPKPTVTWAQAVGSAGGMKDKTASALSTFLTFWDFSRFSVYGDIQAVFDTEPPEGVLEAIAEEDEENSIAPEGIGKSLLGDLNKEIREDRAMSNANNSSSSRRGSAALFAEPAEETTTKPAKKQKRRTSQTGSGSGTKTKTDPLRREFASSSNSDSDSSHPHSSSKPLLRNRGERMDSIIDYSGDGDSNLQEANARLHNLEEGMKRLESLLLQVLDPGGEEEDREEGGEGQREVERQAESGILE
jgi:hypothetical protein